MDEEELIFVKNSKKQKNSNQFIRNGILGKSIVKGYISGELSLQNMQNTLKRQKSINATNNNGLKDNIKLYNELPHNSSYKVLSKRMTLGPDKISNLLKMEKSFANKHIDNSIYLDKNLNNKSNT